MMFSEDDVTHISNTLKSHWNNLSISETLAITFQILRGLECYKNKVHQLATKDSDLKQTINFSNKEI